MNWNVALKIRLHLSGSTNKVNNEYKIYLLDVVVAMGTVTGVDVIAVVGGIVVGACVVVIVVVVLGVVVLGVVVLGVVVLGVVVCVVDCVVTVVVGDVFDVDGACVVVVVGGMVVWVVLTVGVVIWEVEPKNQHTLNREARLNWYHILQPWVS